MADHGVDFDERLVVHLGIELVVWKVGAERTAELRGAERTSGKRAAAVAFDELARGDAEGLLDEAALLDVAGELEGERAARFADAEVAIVLAALVEDDRHRGEAEHVVDDGRLAEQALDRRQRRLVADETAAAFEAFQHRGFFAADIGAGAHAHEELEVVRRALDGAAEPVGLGGDADRFAQRVDRVRIFGADVDVALGGADGDAGDRHAFDEAIGIAFHQHAIGEGAAVALVGVAADVFLIGLGVVDRLPLDAGREAGAAAAAQAGGGYFGDDVERRHGERVGEAGEAAVGAVVLDRQRIGDAAARERQALLVLEVRDLVGEPVRELVLFAVEELRLEQARRRRPASPGRRRRGPPPSRLRPAAPATACRASRCGRSRPCSCASWLPRQLPWRLRRRPSTARRHRAGTKTLIMRRLHDRGR